jgi:hypothetical protein
MPPATSKVGQSKALERDMDRSKTSSGKTGDVVLSQQGMPQHD